MKCPNCAAPNESHLVFLDGRDEHGNHKGWQEWRLCSTCGGTNEISDERAKWIEDGKRLRKERIERGETQREAGARLGIDFCRLSRIEAGREPMPPPKEASREV